MPAPSRRSGRSSRRGWGGRLHVRELAGGLRRERQFDLDGLPRSELHLDAAGELVAYALAWRDAAHHVKRRVLRLGVDERLLEHDSLGRLVHAHGVTPDDDPTDHVLDAAGNRLKVTQVAPRLRGCLVRLTGVANETQPMAPDGRFRAAHDRIGGRKRPFSRRPQSSRHHAR